MKVAMGLEQNPKGEWVYVLAFSGWETKPTEEQMARVLADSILNQKDFEKVPLSRMITGR